MYENVNLKAQELMAAEQWQAAIDLIEQVSSEARGFDLNWRERGSRARRSGDGTNDG